MTNCMIKVEHLRKKYTRGKEVISDLNLSFGEVGLNVICGKSGCGKTTLINILGAMDLQFEGNVTVDGLNLLDANYTQIADYRNFISAFVFQKNSLFEYLTVKENLELCLNIQNNDANISEALERVGLKGFENKKVKALSGGEKQRVAIARALIKDCKVIFADEPTSALDSKNAHKIFQLFKELSKDKLVIVVTHDVKKATMYADRLIRLIDGNIEEDVVYNDIQTRAKELAPRKSKPFSMMPIFKHNLKTGLVINLFVMILLILGICITNIALEQKKVKSEYDNYVSDNNTFNADRAIYTEIKNGIDQYKIVRKGNATDPYYYLKNAIDVDETLSSGDYNLITNNIPSKYDLYEGTSTVKYKNLLIEGVSNVTKYSYNSNGIYYYWSTMSETNFQYYVYDKNNDYDLVAGRLPQGENEILVTDTVADLYLRRRAYSPGVEYQPYYSEYVVDYNDLLNDTYSLSYNPDYAKGNGLNPDDAIIKENVFTIHDVYSSVKGQMGGSTSDTNATYYLYNSKDYKVVGVIRTGLLDYYTYNYSQNRYYLLSMADPTSSEYAEVSAITGHFPGGFQVQKDEAFMNSLYYQPGGYVVLPEALEGDNVTQYKYAPYEVTAVYANGTALKNNISAFAGQYDYTGYGFVGFSDSISKDTKKRILAKSIDRELYSDEVIISVETAQKLFPSAKITKTNASKNFESVNGKTINVSFIANGHTIEKELKVVGICNNFDGNFYMSDSLFSEVYLTQKGTTPTLSVNLKGENLASRKRLMKKLYELGYCLVPEDSMPGAYLEFTEGKGEMIAEVDYEGLSSLYPNHDEIIEGANKYFYNNDVNFGIISGEYVYMTSSMVRQIALDDSYYTSMGNISPYYLYSDYYNSNVEGCVTNSDTGNSLLEIVDGLYQFFFAVALILSIGFIILKEFRQSESVTKLSMLGVRNKDLIALNLLTYIPMMIIVGGISLVLSRILVDVINSLYTYRFYNGLLHPAFNDVILKDANGNYVIIETVVNRIRIMFTSTTYLTTIISTISVLAITLLGSIIVTLKSRK